MLAASDGEASRSSVTMHSRARQSFATTTYGATVLPKAVSMLFAGYNRVNLTNAQGVQG